MHLPKLINQAKIIVLALALALGISYVSAAGTWTPPTATPPGGMVDVPINVGSNAQIKAGDLGVGAFLANLNSQFLGNVTIGTTTSPAQLRLVNGTQGAGKVLTSDANGNATWAAGTASTAGPSVYAMTLNTTKSSNSTSWVDTGLAITTTPTAANSKFLINVNVSHSGGTVGGLNCEVGLFKRTGSDATIAAPFSTGSAGNAVQAGFVFLDQATDTTPRTYTVMLRQTGTDRSGSYPCYVYSGATTMSIVDGR